MNINVKIRFPDDTPDNLRENILQQLNTFAIKNKDKIDMIPEEQRENAVYRIVIAMLKAEGIDAELKEPEPKFKPPDDLSGIDLSF